MKKPESPVTFKILNYDYINTGGNTMVGIFTVWLPEELRTVYALTNEDGCNLSVVDYISNELDIYDYDELIFDHCTFGTLHTYDKYFELYRYCLNKYTKSDCRYFGITRAIPFYLLSDELQAKVDDDYLVWLTQHNYDVLTDGEIITKHPDYTDDDELKLVCKWKAWHDGLINNTTDDDELETLYDERYRLYFHGKRVYLPFNADTFNRINDLLDAIIKEW